MYQPPQNVPTGGGYVSFFVTDPWLCVFIQTKQNQVYTWNLVAKLMMFRYKLTLLYAPPCGADLRIPHFRERGAAFRDMAMPLWGRGREGSRRP